MNSTIIPPNRNLNQWMRYFPFERRTWRQVIGQSGLPQEAQMLVREIVAKSRLMRYEKIEVTQELIGHFLDGELLGKTYPQMIANFGDSRLTAQLIRRSKKRNRPVMLKITHIIGWMFFGILAIYFSVYVYFHSASPSPSHDYLADLNALNLDVDDDEKAWPVYREQWLKFDFSESGKFNKEIMPVFYVNDSKSEDEYDERLIESQDEQWPDAVAKLQEITPLLDAFREGATKQRMGFELKVNPRDYSDEDIQALFSPETRENLREPVSQDASEIERLADGAFIGILLPHLQQFRQAARLLTVDTRWAVEQGDSDRVVQNIEAFLGISEHVADSNVLVGSLVGFAISGIGYNSLEEVLISDPDFFSDEQLQRLMERIGRVSYPELTRIEGERAMMLDMIQRTYSDDGNGNGRVTAVGVKTGMKFASDYSYNMSKEDEPVGRAASIAQNAIAPVSLFMVADRKSTTNLVNEFIDEYSDSLKQDYWERTPVEMEEFIENNKFKYPLLSLMMPAIDNVIRATDRLTGRQEGILAALAVHRYRLANGEWPDDLVSLSPDFIAELPVDVINGNELNLSANGEGPVIYSVGHDRDDDGGIQAVDKFGNLVPAVYFGGSNNGNSDGDWVLWPQSRFDKSGPAEKN